MFWTKTFIPTLKETPQDAESISHQLLLRAGAVRMLMAGVYSYLPLGLKVLGNIENIIRQEMNSCGAVELLLPAL
ncbi:MAG: proline--tRNA ligase, partial [Candidatus Omnitrophica bacterium]|nr:proline--tRNA ligase [Candidatus Omnitrophota bacterium]